MSMIQAIKNILTELYFSSLRRLLIATMLRTKSRQIQNRQVELKSGFPEYRKGLFAEKPIICNSMRYTGFIRKFEGPFDVEYETGFFYKGIRLINKSWDGLHRFENYPRTNPFRKFKRKRQHINSAIILKSNWCHNYYHFLTDYLQKVFFVELSDIPLDVPFVVDEEMTKLKFFNDAIRLKLFGVRPIFIHKKDHWLSATTLYHVHPDRFYDEIQDKYIEKLGIIPDQLAHNRLFITRDLSRNFIRGITNENELIPHLLERNFSVIDPAEYSLERQADLFSKASIVVGPHGAGLTNILFRAGARLSLVELIGVGKKWNHHFYEFCQHYKFNYDAIAGTPDNPDNEESSFSVDIGDVLNAVDEAIKTEKEFQFNNHIRS